MDEIMSSPSSTLSQSISKIQYSAAQQEVEQTPSDPILPPQPSGVYEVDQSVTVCELSGIGYRGMVSTHYCQPFLFLAPKLSTRKIMACHCGERLRRLLWTCRLEKRKTTS